MCLTVSDVASGPRLLLTNHMRQCISPHNNCLLTLTQLYAFNIDMSCGAHSIAVAAFSCLLLCKTKVKLFYVPEVVINKSALSKLTKLG